MNPAWVSPDHDVAGNNTRTSPPWRRRGTLARAVRNVEPSPHVFAWAEEFFAHLHPAKTLNGSLPALSGLSILTHKNKKEETR
jgi:hypothetical protein